ncbi:MAG: nucleotidyltransferase family protein [Clostridia bacterium]|nr:nucleotidyltransferase family protein [Clostridia bacterium]
MNEAQIYLLSILRRQMGVSDTMPFPKNEQLRRDIVEESIRQSVCLSLFDSLYESERDNGVAYRTLKKYADATYKNNIEGYEHHREASALLAKHGIDHAIIKGIASDRFYKKRFIRAIGDVDVIIHPDTLECAGKALVDEGFKLIENTGDHHRAYIKGACRIELHHTVGSLPVRLQGELDNIIFGKNGIIESADTLRYGDTDIPVASAFFHGLTLLVHTAGHIQNEGIGLRHLYDWAAFMQSCEDPEGSFGDTPHMLGLMHLARVLTKACEYIGLTPRTFSQGVPDDTAKALIEDIFAVGNMGAKNTDDRFSSVNRNSEKKAEGMLPYLVKTLNNHVYTHIPAAKKHKLLLVPGYAYVLVRRLWLRLTGKRARINIGKSYDSAIRRDRLIRSLELYEEKK